MGKYMLDKWFISEVENKLKEKDRLVIIDEQGTCDFLVDLIDKNKYVYFEVASEIDEIKAKYQIEKFNKDKKCIIYTKTHLFKLKFIREYCETNDKIHIQYLYRYINDKVFESIKDNLKLNAEEVVAVGKQSFGKNIDYWKTVHAVGIRALFENFENETLKFLDTPKNYLTKLDTQSRKNFLELVNSITKSENIEKPAETTAKELSNAIFDNLIFNKKNETLDKIYKNWTDSRIYESTFFNYGVNYKLPDMFNIWDVAINHPFKEIDKTWLKEISSNIEDKDFINSKIQVIKKRAENTYANIFGITFWEHVLSILTYDNKQVNKLNNFNEIVNFYKTSFSKIDTAIRHLYTYFLQDKDILKPIQEYFTQLLNNFMKKWFDNFDNYKENQTGLLKNIISSEPTGTAIIVGDGLSFEISQEIIKKIGNVFKISIEHTFADFPSETENNMSRLFISNGKVEAIQTKREQLLKDDTGKNIDFIDLDNISFSPPKADYLICKVKDIDSLGEKFQHQALKYLDTIETEIIEKIKILLISGYNKVFITTDHGFVLTGILTDSDKVNFNINYGESDKKERYIASNSDVSNLPVNIIKIEKHYKNFKYLYFSKGISPFTTTGAYGYSHGGISPQELIIPLICIEKEGNDIIQLKVQIENKEELKEVAGEIYSVKIKGISKDSSLFASERKVQIVCLKDSKEFYRSDIKTINADETIKFENNFVNDDFDLIITDYQSMETLDKTKIKKKIIRDLGGLL
jgi:hypothetical protein